LISAIGTRKALTGTVMVKTRDILLFVIFWRLPQNPLKFDSPQIFFKEHQNPKEMFFTLLLAQDAGLP